MKVTFTVAFPQSAGNAGDTRAAFQRAMLEGLHTVSDPMLQELKEKTPYASISGAYSQSDLSTANGVQVTLSNSSSIFPFRENDTRPHWPPFGPGSSLAAWSSAHGIPPFLVARKISRVGTTGNHIFQQTWDAYKPRIDMAVQNALFAWLTESALKASGGTA